MSEYLPSVVIEIQVLCDPLTLLKVIWPPSLWQGDSIRSGIHCILKPSIVGLTIVYLNPSGYKTKSIHFV